jgi:farnesyl diphosphate synthase
MSSALKEYLDCCQTRIEQALNARLPSEAILPQRLHQAMRYSTLDGGKRMRPLLVYATGKVLGIAEPALDAVACAVEFIHVYSLIHDDLPALAFETLANDASLPVTAAQRLKMVAILTKASGSQGMVGGQAIDLQSVGTQLTLPELENMHIHKTGALIRASVNMAAVAKADLDPLVAKKLDHYAKCIGLSFQVKDDILDEESDTTTLGKTQGKDQHQHKPTYPALLGLNGAKQKAQELHEQALLSLSEFGSEANLLRDLSLYIIQRDH